MSLNIKRAVEVLGKGLVLPGGDVLQGLVLVDDGLDAAGDLPVEAFQLLVQINAGTEAGACRKVSQVP